MAVALACSAILDLSLRSRRFAAPPFY